MTANPNLTGLFGEKSLQKAFVVPEEDAGMVLQTLRQICDIRSGGEDKKLFLAFLRAEGRDAQAELFDYLDGLSTKEIERVMVQMERRLKRSRSAA
jgi:hypothetical protein